MMLDHHAYLYRLKEVDIAKVTQAVKKFEISEIEKLDLNNFGIDDSRALVETAYKRPEIGEQKLIIVALKNITVEAQQALLKILEEPPKTAVFVFCVPVSLYLLPTLLSRFHIDQEFQFLDLENDQPNFLSFKALSKADRIAEVTAKMVAKDTDWVASIKIGLISFLSNKSFIEKSDNGEILLWIAKHLQTRGASNKHLLEELALTL